MFYAILIVLVAIVYGIVRMKETFVLKYGNPFDDEDILSTDINAKGTRIFGITPDTCPCAKPELDAGLCYEKCEEGYHGVGPVCWADTVNIGIGKVLLLNSCVNSGYGADWTDTGLLCNEPLKWNDCKFRGLFNECWGGLEGGRVKPKSLTCDGYGDRTNIDGLCYKACPKSHPNHVPAMPYLCFKGSRGLSYGRGAGDVPSIFTFERCTAKA